MKIPEVRTELLYLAREMRDLGHTVWPSKIEALEKELHRREFVRKVSPRRHVKLDPAKVKAYIADNPDADYMEIAHALGGNSGRVSEALAGKRQ